MIDGTDDIAPLLVPGGTPALRFGQGRIVAWDPETLRNTIQWRDVLLEDIPVLSGVSALGYQPGEPIALLGWDAGGGKGASQWWVLGRLAIPGQDSPDVVIRGSDLEVSGGRILLRAADGSEQIIIDRTSAGGGQLRLFHPNGTIAFHAGELVSAGTGERVGVGFFSQQDNGTDVLGAAPFTPGGKPVIRGTSGDGNLVLSTGTDGFGLDRPYLDVPMYMTNSTGDVRTDSASFSTRWLGRLRHTHPALHLQARAWVDSSTEGEIRISVNGIQVGSTETVSSTTASFFDFGASVHNITGLGMAYNEFQAVELDARVTSGAGQISVIPYGITKRGL